jgi:hypothetical protein
MDADLTANSASEPDMPGAETISGQHHLKRVTYWTLSARKREFFNQSNSAKGEQ